MQLLTFRSLWTNGFDLDAALKDCGGPNFDGVEGPLPEEANAKAAFVAKIKDHGVPFIAEVTTGGGYVPTTRRLHLHIEDFARKAEVALEAEPIFITVLGGSDSWHLPESVEFFGQALEVADELGVKVSFETHRSRSTFSPWATSELLEQLPAMMLTADFSHWCCVCERLVLDEEPAILKQVAARTTHIHARVGYEQGPQVPHPAAPEYAGALSAHEGWWSAIWRAQMVAGRRMATLTPECGPDGYLHTVPFTGTPVASLDEINHWMAARQRERLASTHVSVAA
jgi:sugar phosphate isomerase/epimerase